MHPEVQKALDILKKHPDIASDSEQMDAVRSMEENLNSLILSKQVASSEPIQKQVKHLAGLVRDINLQLIFNPSMTEDERKGLFRDRDMLIMYLKLNSVEDIDKLIADQVEEIMQEEYKFTHEE